MTLSTVLRWPRPLTRNPSSYYAHPSVKAPLNDWLSIVVFAASPDVASRSELKRLRAQSVRGGRREREVWVLEFHRPGGGTACLRCPGTEVRLPRADRYRDTLYY